jgi:maltooligosyltrehalose trehalohydrolase
MLSLPMEQLGARETSPNVLKFGIFLPGVDPARGYAVSVKIIHEDDQYIQSVQPVILPQTHSVDPRYGDYWSGTVNLSAQPATANAKSWGDTSTATW